jgi:hypothetical protein
MNVSKERAEHYKKLAERCKPACPKGHGPSSNITSLVKEYLPVEREIPVKTKQVSLV